MLYIQDTHTHTQQVDLTFRPSPMASCVTESRCRPEGVEVKRSYVWCSPLMPLSVAASPPPVKVRRRGRPTGPVSAPTGHHRHGAVARGPLRLAAHRDHRRHRQGAAAVLHALRGGQEPGGPRVTRHGTSVGDQNSGLTPKGFL